MASSPVVKIGITFADRDGNRAVVTTYCAFATPIADAYDYALQMAGAIGAISDSVLVSIAMAWRWTIDDPGDPGDSSDVARKMLLLIVNEDGEINGVTIPSPADNWETSGSYAGIRLDLASAGALGFVDMLEAIDLRTDDNRDLGILLVAGGLAL